MSQPDLFNALAASGWVVASHWQDRATSWENVQKLRKRGIEAKRTSRGEGSAKEFSRVGKREGGEVKANRVPASVRIKLRIERLIEKVGLTEPIGGGNPYYRCVYCKRSEPEISCAGHYKGCPEPGYRKQIRHYKTLLNSQEANTQ